MKGDLKEEQNKSKTKFDTTETIAEHWNEDSKRKTVNIHRGGSAKHFHHERQNRPAPILTNYSHRVRTRGL